MPNSFYNFCYFGFNIVADQKQAWLATIFCFLYVSIAPNLSLPPLPYRCSGVPNVNQM